MTEVLTITHFKSSYKENNFTLITWPYCRDSLTLELKANFNIWEDPNSKSGSILNCLQMYCCTNLSEFLLQATHLNHINPLNSHKFKNSQSIKFILEFKNKSHIKYRSLLSPYYKKKKAFKQQGQEIIHNFWVLQQFRANTSHGLIIFLLYLFFSAV